jgi:hypothetical protein
MANGHEELKQLFGLSNNDTTGFYLKTLYEIFNVTGNIAITKSFGPGEKLLPVRCRNRFFTTGPDDDNLHQEWLMFRALLVERLGDKNYTNFNSGTGDNRNNVSRDTILEIIRKHAGYNARDPLKFEIKVIQAHLASLTGMDVDINQPVTWINAFDFTFKANFDDIFADADFDVTISSPVQFKMFHYNLNKYAVKELMTIAGEAVDDFWTKNDIIDDTIYRSKSEPLKLYKIGNDGNPIDIDVGSNLFRQSKENGNHVTCKNYGVGDTSKNTCSDFLSKCILDGTPNDITKCKEFLFDPNFWSIITDEINSMLPYYIITTLDTFGFKTIINSNNSLIEYQSLGKWLEGLSVQIDNKVLSKDEYENIAKNTRLTQYLTRLVNKVNSNPAILNENYVGAIIPNEDIDLPFRNTHFYKLGLRPRRYPKDDTLVNFTRQSNMIISNFNNLRINSQYRMNIGPMGLMQNGLLYTIPTTYINGGLIGGGIMVNAAPVPAYNIIQNVDKFPFRQYPELKAIAHSLEERMKVFGKHLSRGNKEQLEKELNTYRASEEKLFKAIKYVDKYIDLLTDKQYDKENNLTMSHLEDFVNEREKYFARTEMGQSNVINTMMSLAESVTADLTANVDLIDGKYQPIKKNV